MLLAPRQRLGALGVLLDAQGRVLVARHALRVQTPWGLPGGFVERGEHPAAALAREFQEELGLRIAVRELLHCAQDGVAPGHDGPSGLTLVYACRLVAPSSSATAAVPVRSWELLEARWLALEEFGSLVRGYEAEAVRVAAALPSAPRTAAS